MILYNKKNQLNYLSLSDFVKKIFYSFDFDHD
jgi:hypothetical protein